VADHPRSKKEKAREKKKGKGKKLYKNPRTREKKEAISLVRSASNGRRVQRRKSGEEGRGVRESHCIWGHKTLGGGNWGKRSCVVLSVCSPKSRIVPGHQKERKQMEGEEEQCLGYNREFPLIIVNLPTAGSRNVKTRKMRRMEKKGRGSGTQISKKRRE